MKHRLSLLAQMLTATCVALASGGGILPETEGRLFAVGNSHVNKICQDYKGYIWLATDYGLTRFDGVEAVEFTRDDRAGSLLSNSVLTIMEDSGRHLWVGTTNGIQKLDPSTMTFSTPRLSYPDVPDFSYVNSIIEDRKGNVWFTTSRSGVVCIAKDRPEPICYMTTNSSICSNKTSELFEDRFGNIWIGSMDAGVTVFNPTTNSMKTLAHDPGNAATLSSDMIFSIAQANDGRLFIGSPDGGVDAYDYRTNKVTRNAIDVEGIVYILKNSPEENAMYIGTDGNGLHKYDFATQRLSRVEIATKEFDFSRSKIHDIVYDCQGHLWLGVFQKGPVMALGNKDNNVVNLGYNPFTPSLHTGTEPVLCALQSVDGAMWIGTDGDGIYRADFFGAPFRHMAVPESGAGVVLTFYQDSRGIIWAGNYLEGLTRYNPGSGRFEPVDLPLPVGMGGRVKEVNAIAEAPDGKLWIGTNGNGVCIYDPADASVRFLDHDPLGEPEHQLLGNAVHSIVFDGDGAVWIGTSDAGLSRMDLASGTFKHFNTSNMQLSNNCVMSLCLDASGAVWAGTQMGLNRIKDNHTQIFNTSHGLLDNLVYGITTDQNCHLWISTGKGISALNTETLEFDNAIPAGKLAAKEFKRGSVCRGLDGRLYFGGVGGMVSFMPGESTDSHRLMRVDFNGLKVLAPGAREALAEREPGAATAGSDSLVSLIDRQSITLDFEANSFTVSFGAVEFSNPEDVRYSVRLDDHDKGWIDLPDGVRVATWSLVPPGEYNLRVRASVNGFEPIENVIRLIIRPPFYLTTWAKCLYVVLALLAGCGIVWFVRWKLEQIKRRNRQLLDAEANEMKLQYFTDISHEIRTPLTMILTPLGQLRERTRDRESLRTIDVMLHNGNRILRLIDQIIDLRRFDNNRMRLDMKNVRLREFVADISQAFSVVAEQRNIVFTTDIATDVPDSVVIDADKIDKVLFNVLGNAFKFTPEGGQIGLQVAVADGCLAIRVSDTGPGIPRESVENVFDRFYRVHDWKSNSAGSGIGLHLSRKMIDLHGGSISVESTSESGTVFLITIPLAVAASEAEECASEDAGHHAKVTAIPSAAAVPAIDAPASTKHATVLIVEDDDSIREYLVSKLAAHFNVVTATNGMEGLDKALTDKPDLVLTDVMMDGIDGLELCRKLRANPQICEVPVVMLTAKTTESQKNEGILAGADAYVTKPFNYTHLLNRMNMLIHSRRQLKKKYSGTEAVNEEVVKTKSSDERLMERVRKVVVDELSNPDLSVEFIAERVGVSRSHLHRRLKIVANMNPSEYIRSERMRHAAALLVSKNVGVSEVAYATGFSTLSHFSTCFKEYFGMSPTRYIALKRGNQEVTVHEPEQ